MSTPSDPSATSARITRWLRCPACHAPLTVTGGEILCPSSGFRGSIRDDVAVMLPEATESFFDDTFEFMMHGKLNPGDWSFSYAQQVESLTKSLKPGMLLVDVGCGPGLPYAKPDGVEIIGLEPSFKSIRVNRQVDLRVFGSAYAMPLADASVDAIVCFYAIHHMVGEKVNDSISNLSRAFREFGRVLKPNGTLFVFEMTPIALFQCIQALGWNLGRQLIGKKLDMRFFSAREVKAVGGQALPKGTILEMTEFKVSPFTIFAPVFSLPRIRIPRFMYPLAPRLYKWRMPSS